MNENNGQLSKRVWLGIILFMFVGSLAGALQSSLIGVFLDRTIFVNGAMGARITLTDAVNIITSGSAVIACVTAFIMGTLSEKLKNRKLFISVGYIVWGIITVLFGVIKKEVVADMLGYSDAAQVVATTTIMVISFALVMAFVHATSDDAAYDAWLTDVTTPQTTVIVETLVTVMGFVTTGIITAMITKAQAGKVSYNTLFVMVGIFAIIAGISGFRIIDNPKKFAEKNDNAPKTSYWADLFYGFRPKAIKENTNLYLMLLSGCTFNCAVQSFVPYLIIYITSVIVPANEGMDVNIGGIAVFGVMALTIALEGVLILMKLVNIKKAYSFIPSVICFIVGVFLLSTTKNIYLIVVALTPGLIGYITIMIQFAATVRNNIPRDKVGLFQGIRVIFLGMIPMIVGPTVGNIAAKNSTVTFTERYAERLLPTEDMFLYAACIGVLIFIPMLIFLKRDSKKSLEENNE